jgi:hypothetical protein
MRAVLIIVVTLALLAGVFFAVVSWQSRPTSLQSSTTQPRIMNLPPATRPAIGPDTPQRIGSGERPAVQSHDSKTGEISSEFSADRYDPVANDAELVDVAKPVAKFYLGKPGEKQLLVIRGESGRVRIPGTGGRDKMRGVSGAPTRGELKQVRIELFDPQDAPQPQVVCTMPNASFDNDQFRIFTDAWQDDNGVTVPGDQVPVKVRGQYEFDGRGLEITWNERDRRLQSLEIAHGERLVIHDVKSLKLSGNSLSPLPEALVDADPKALPPSAKKKPKKKPASKPVPGRNEVQRDRTNPVYRATFFDNVKILEGDKPIGEANELLVDFLMNLSQKPATQPSSSPATQPSNARVSRRDDVELAALDNAEQQIQGPITVKWTGRLLVTPVDDGSEAPPQGETNIALIGSPVKIDRQGSHVVAAKVTYRTGDSGFTASADEKTPQVLLTDARGMKITTTSIEYGGVGEVATLEGKSHAEIPLERTNPNDPVQVVKADWNDSCTLTLSGDRVDALQISEAELSGDVTINHPQIHGRSDALKLQFESDPTAPATQPTMMVKELTATGKVDYAIIDETQQAQSIQAESLNVLAGKTPHGEFYASALNATGNVHTKDPDRELFANRLAVRLAPSTQPSDNADKVNFEVESLQAEEQVRIISANGQYASADRVTISSKNGSRRVELMGLPVATVSDSESTLVGPTIRFDPDTGDAAVVGGGSLSAVQKSVADAKGRRITAKWAGDLQLRGRENLATINGPVTVSSPSDDGSVNTARGGKLLITLADAPTTKPTGKSVAGFGDVSGFSSKVIQSYSLRDDVEVRSVLADANGALLRRMHLFTQTLNYEQATQKLLVPGPGRMLVEDNRKDATAATQPALLGGGNLRGATAFEWQRELTYDETAGHLEMNGDTRVVHKGGDDAPFEVFADSLSADIARGPADARGEMKVDVKNLHARGSVMFTSKQIQFDAHTVDYDPAAHRLIASSSPGRFAEVEYLGASGIVHGSFSQLVFNTQMNEMESMRDFRATLAR